MTPALTIAAVAFILLLSTSGAAARRRRIGGGGSTYCVNDQNQRVPCVSTIVGAVIGGIGSCPNTTRTNVLTAPFRLVFLLIILCVCLAVWRRRRSRHRMALLPATTAAKHHPETSTIASGSTNTNTADTIVQPPPAYMRFPHHEPDNHNASPKVAPVGTYAAPQGPPPAI